MPNNSARGRLTAVAAVAHDSWARDLPLPAARVLGPVSFSSFWSINEQCYWKALEASKGKQCVSPFRHPGPQSFARLARSGHIPRYGGVDDASILCGESLAAGSATAA